MGKLKRMIASLSMVAIISSFVLPAGAFAFSMDTVPSWAQAGVQALVDAGSIDGDAPSYRSGDYVNRAELAKLISVTWDLADGATKDFPDVEPGDWFYTPVQRAYAAGVLGGYPDGTFRPAQFVNRAEAVKMLVEASGVEMAVPTADFDDVPVDAWFAGYVTTGVREGWLSGYPDGTFRPGDYMNRAEVAKTLAMAAGLVEPGMECAEGMMMEDGVCVDMPVAPVAGDVTVSVSPMTPATTSVPAGASSVTFAAFDFTAGAETGMIDEVEVTRKGIIKDSNFDGIYLYHQDGTRLTSKRSLNSDTHSATFSNLDLEVPAGKTVTLYVRADMAAAGADFTAGDARFEISSADMVLLEGGATAGGSFPVSGNLMAIQETGVGTITVEKSGTVTDATIGEFAKIAEFRLRVDNEDALLKQIALTIGGSIDESGITDIELRSQDGDVLAMTPGVMGDEDLATFVLPEDYMIPEGSRRFTVHAQLTGDAGDTVQVYVEENTDVFALGDDFGQGLRVEKDEYDGNPCTGDAGADHCSFLTLEGGDVTLAFNGPEARDVSLDGEDIRLLEFSMTSVAEVSVEEMQFKVFADDDDDNDAFDGGSGDGADADGLIDNGSGEANLTDIKVIDIETGRTVMSSEELSTTDDDAAVNGTDAVQTLTFTDTFQLEAGETMNLALTADTSNVAGFEDEKIGATLVLSGGALELEDANGDTVAASEIVPSTDMTGNTMTVIDAELFTSLAGTPPSDSYVKGTKLVPLVGINFRASDAEDITVTDLTLTCYSDTDTNVNGVDNSDGNFGENDDVDVQDYISSLELYLNGEKVAGPESVEADGTAQFDNMNWDIMAGTTPRLVVKANFAKPSNLDGFDDVACGIENVSDVVAQDEDGDSVDADSAVNNEAVLDGGNGVKITVKETGTLTYREEGSPSSKIIIGGSNDVLVSKYKFTSVNEAFLVQNLDVFMALDGADVLDATSQASINGVTLKYTDAEGVEQMVDGNFAAGEALFTGLDFYVPENDDAYLEIYADLNTTQAGATSGADIRLLLDDSALIANNNIEAVGAGSGQTLFANSAGLTVPTNTSNVESHYLRKSKPTVVMVSDETDGLYDGKNTLYEYTVTADDAGSISMKAIRFNVTADAGVGADIELLKFQRNGDDITDEVAIFSVGDGTLADGTDLTVVDVIDDTFSGYVVVLFNENATAEEVVAAGETITYELTAIYQGIADGSTTTVYIEEDGAATANFDVPALINFVNYDADPDADLHNFVWSDNSADNHSTDTADWTNGYRVQGLRGDSEVRSLSENIQ